MKLYRIADWESLYEVTDGGGVWKPGQKKRKGPFPYIRLTCEGSHLSHAHRRMTGLAGRKDAAALYGVWCKLLELAGEHNEDSRGAIWVRPGMPATTRDIADMVEFDVKDVTKALEVLSHPEVGWLTIDSAETPGKQTEIPLESPEVPGNSKETQGKTGAAIILVMPCRGKAKEWRLTRTVLEGFIADYPSIDCLHQLKRARGWLESKVGEPEQWTSRGMAKALHRWLAGEEEGPGKNPDSYHRATKDDRWESMRAIFPDGPDWPKERLIAAVSTAKEKSDRKRKRIRDEENTQARDAEAASKRSKGQPSSIGGLIEEQMQGEDQK